MTPRILPLITLLLLLLSACDDRPSSVLSRGKMEDVLYDYHIMQGIIEHLPYEEREEKAQDYINAVYAKHGITEAEFDSSIVYYNRHTSDLHTIYEHLKERYNAVNENLQIVNGNNDMMAIFSTGGDTTNLWNSTKLIALRNKDILNTESFTIHADTSFRRHDQFILTLTPVFMKESKEYYDVTLNIGLSIHYANGHQSGITRTVNANGIQQFTNVTLPMLTPTIFFNLVQQTINSFLAFTQCKLITNGQPRNSTLFYTVYQYNKAFPAQGKSQMGYASALAWIMLIIVSVVTMLLFKSRSKWVFDA